VNPNLLFAITLGGVAALDATPVAQTLLSQPLVTGTLLGWIWGDWRTALETAVVLQIFAASTAPVGSRTPEDYATGGVVGTALALTLAGQETFEFARQASVLLGVLAGMLTATLGVVPLKWQRRRNEGLSRWCEAGIREGDPRALAASHGAAVALAFGIGVGYTALCLALGTWVLSDVVARESVWLARAWRLAHPILLGVGLAQLLNTFVQRRIARAALFGVSLVGVWLMLMIGGE
jgi:mannose/fructose/N-acetylgalactosamine-specific phosphotransferase system component IIC